MLFCVTGFAVSAGGTIGGTVLVFSKNLSGDEFSVPVEIADCKGIVSLIISVEYERSAVQLTEFQNGNFFGVEPTAGETYQSYPYKIYWETTLSGNKTGSGELVKLKFKRIGKSDNGIRVKVLDCFDENYNDVSLNTEITSEEFEDLKNDGFETEEIDITNTAGQDGTVTVDNSNFSDFSVSEVMPDGTKNGLNYKTENGKITVYPDKKAKSLIISGIKKDGRKWDKKVFISVLAVFAIAAVFITAIYIKKRKDVKNGIY